MTFTPDEMFEHVKKMLDLYDKGYITKGELITVIATSMYGSFLFGYELKDKEMKEG